MGRLTDFFNAHLTEAGTAYKTGGSFSPIKLHLVQLPCPAPQTFRSRQIWPEAHPQLARVSISQREPTRALNVGSLCWCPGEGGPLPGNPGGFNWQISNTGLLVSINTPSPLVTLNGSWQGWLTPRTVSLWHPPLLGFWHPLGCISIQSSLSVSRLAPIHFGIPSRRRQRLTHQCGNCWRETLWTPGHRGWWY